MQKFLIVGIDTIAGANIAATFAPKYRVATWSAQAGYEIANCEAIDSELTPPEVISESECDAIIYCSPASRSNWEPPATSSINDQMIVELQDWTYAAAAANVKFVMISSDAVFTGPWMFHDEDSRGVCRSYQAQIIRTAEDHVQEVCKNSLILRTHVFGWSPLNENGWLESLLKRVETQRIVQQDHIRHASPILATDFAEILDRACQEELTGIYHVAGAERINPLQFTQRLSDRFDLPWLAMRSESSLTEIPTGFGESECSLQTKKIRKDLCVAMPLLSEGLERLCQQFKNGYAEQLHFKREATPAKRLRAA